MFRCAFTKIPRSGWKICRSCFWILTQKCFIFFHLESAEWKIIFRLQLFPPLARFFLSFDCSNVKKKKKKKLRDEQTKNRRNLEREKIMRKKNIMKFSSGRHIKYIAILGEAWNHKDKFRKFSSCYHLYDDKLPLSLNIKNITLAYEWMFMLCLRVYNYMEERLSGRKEEEEAFSQQRKKKIHKFANVSLPLVLGNSSAPGIRK